MTLHTSRLRTAIWLMATLAGLGSTAPALAAGFPDVPADHWAQPAITSLSGDSPLLEPLADGMFHGDAPFTRVQFAHLMGRLITEIEGLAKASIASPATGRFTFADVPASHPDRALLVRLAEQYRLYEGVAHLDRDYFGANEVVSRYEMAVVVDNLMRQAEAKDAVRVRSGDAAAAFPFQDVPETAWARPIVASVSGRYRVMVGFPDRTFRGDEELTRYQFAAVAAQSVPLIRALVARTVEEKTPPSAPQAPVMRVAPYRADVLLGLTPTTSLGIGLGARQAIGDWFIGERLRLVPLGVPGGAAGEIGVQGGYTFAPQPNWRVQPSLAIGFWGSNAQMLQTVGYGLETVWQFAPAWDLHLGVEGRHGVWSSAGAAGAWLPAGDVRFGFWPTEQVSLTFGVAAWGLPTAATGIVVPAVGPQVGMTAKF
jgi:hypothetical protein